MACDSSTTASYRLLALIDAAQLCGISVARTLQPASASTRQVSARHAQDHRTASPQAEQALDQPHGAHQRHQHRQELRQARQTVGTRCPDERRQEDRDEGELPQLDTDIEPDQRAQQCVAA